MDRSPSHAEVVGDRAASGGRALELSPGGAARKQVATGPIRRIRVKAKRHRCRSVPLIRLSVDGRRDLARVVNTRSQWYSGRKSVAAGRHVIRVSFGRAGRRGRPGCRVRIDKVALVTRVHGRALVRLGSAVWWSRIGEDDRYEKTFLREFDSLTPENEMKMMFLQPRRGQFDFSVADRITAFAYSRGKDVRGHTLVYHSQLPRWLTKPLIPWTRRDLLAVMEDHIKTVVGRYRGRIAEWDVVNEAFAEDGSYRGSLWDDVVGPDYIERAFRWAREADPHARLYYNDIAADYRNAKSDAIYRMAADFKRRGVPLDGVGLQMHVQTIAHPTQRDLASNMARFASLGLEVGITEMDVATSASPGTVGQKLRRQARVYRAAAQACQEQPACKGFTTWGFTDRSTWLGSEERPLIFDTSYRRKPAYYALMEALGRR